MIVTRHRKRRSGSGRLVLALVVVALVVAALAWPPSHRAVADGPLKPAWTVAGSAGNVVARPFTFAAQQQTIADRNREIRDLSGQLERERQAKADADARAQQLEHQATALVNEAPVTPLPVARPAAAPANGLAAIAGSATAASTEERRLAATWAAMEPEKAAAIVQRLPDDAATRVLSQMDADSAGAIMNALPATVAARISRAVAQVPPAAGR